LFQDGSGCPLLFLTSAVECLHNCGQNPVIRGKHLMLAGIVRPPQDPHLDRIRIKSIQVDYESLRLGSESTPDTPCTAWMIMDFNSSNLSDLWTLRSYSHRRLPSAMFTMTE